MITQPRSLVTAVAAVMIVVVLIAAILTFGAGGNGRWFGAMGSTDGVSGTGQVLSPSGFALTMPANTTLHFQLDAPGSAHGSFSTTGLSSFLNPTSGRFTRVFPP